LVDLPPARAGALAELDVTATQPRGGVDGDAGGEGLEVQVHAGGRAGLAPGAEASPDAGLLAGADRPREGPQVLVAHDDAVVELDVDELPAPGLALAVGGDDGAGLGGVHARLEVRGGDVRAVVHAAVLGDRVHAHAERRGRPADG